MFRVIGSSSPKYLAAADILIGDMSDTNYEFLIYDRPIILLSNDWLKKYFPNIGSRSNGDNIESCILDALRSPDAYSKERKIWLHRTYSNPYKNHSKCIIESVINRLNIKNPTINLIHKNNKIYMENLIPLGEYSKKICLDVTENKLNSNNNVINFVAHFGAIPKIRDEKTNIVHVAHGLKGVGTANVDKSVIDYKKNNYFPDVNIFVVAGLEGFKRTTLLLGGNSSRILDAGYPKTDSLLAANTKYNKKLVYKELKIKNDFPLVVYAPAGEISYEKPGGSLNKQIITRLKLIEQSHDLNILVKLKYKYYYQRKAISYLKSKVLNFINK